ncbi:MAG: uroporphyrinogen-III C-methyltransferase [Deltaproteobacteria bacterium]|nr:MAG: uroporphyrinogen-III C-methyltransferase [Deltaproteobacteria bacterium]
MTGRHKPGRVLLVGAGPGDPDLITVRGAQALRSADVVVYDALAAEQLLDLAPPEAQRINVGKRGHDDPTRPQEETTALLLRLAQQGKTVVRLKGGDPFVFGRGGEEASALAEAGIPFEIVPGVSSVIGALAYAGIPITDRRYSASFAVVTGHKDPTRVTQDTRWADLGRAADTLVILMGMRNLEGLVEKIIAGGLSPETPAAVVVDGTLPSQRVVEAPLKQLAERVRAEGLGAPAVVVIGNVVKLRQHLSWIERRPLFGRRVLVTRTPEQASEWMEALRAAGADPQLMPMLRIEAASDLGPLDAALGRLHSYDALLITSANAIRFLAARARERDVLLREFGGSVVCVGPKSAEATLAEGLPVQTVPAERFDAEGMLDAIEKQFPPAGRRFLLPQAEAARETLCEGLRAAGAMVDAVTAYRTLAPDTDAAALCERLTAGRLDVLTFASPSAVRNFMSLLDGAARRAASNCLVAAIGPTTAEALRKEGLAPDVVPERASAADLVAALIEACGAKGPS